MKIATLAPVTSSLQMPSCAALTLRQLLRAMSLVEWLAMTTSN